MFAMPLDGSSAICTRCGKTFEAHSGCPRVIAPIMMPCRVCLSGPGVRCAWERAEFHKIRESDALRAVEMLADAAALEKEETPDAVHG